MTVKQLEASLFASCSIPKGGGQLLFCPQKIWRNQVQAAVEE
jgi:hypothetical protein